MAETTRTPWLERHQVALYLAAILIGVGLGLAVPGSDSLEFAIEPVLGLLLFTTFLSVPFRRLGESLRDVRFLGALGVLNFALVPLVAFALSRLVADDDALLVGALLVLLTPCVDYVIVFTGQAGGSASKLLAAAPLLMLAQMVLLPLYLLLFLGSDAPLIDAGPFIRAFVLLILLPLGAAAVVQALARRFPLIRALESGLLAAMVPLMIATLTVVVASQVRGVGAQFGALARVVPLYIAFAVILVGLGILVARAARLDPATSRALTFSGVTRNSLVVLPLALALPVSLALAPLVVVTQTLVELVVMVALVRILPRLLPPH
ncbi:bile acid:sodium symporter [Microbacterium sp. SSW1-49]|uniref:Bile acid:sodium symporter n=1 Tax=Microbacterium croceum TaxID=2851645 RepID=A0ABT0FGT8_9MICO|nr:bile acid:sodium symporter [Microbacterium croceum]MCK2037285.1 bile acid:sodium symporter [Microbacterium croceum]